MTEPKQTARVYGANFFEKTVSLSPELIYWSSTFDKCEIFIGLGDKVPESCHLEDCVIHLRPGLTFNDLLAPITKMHSGQIIGSTGTMTIDGGKSYGGSYWINCLVLVDGVKRCMYEMALECYEKHYEEKYGKKYDPLAWWKDNAKQRAERLSRAQ